MVIMERKNIKVQYFALLREERGMSAETVISEAQTVKQFYEELKRQHHFRLTVDVLRVAVNDEFKDWDTILKDGDRVVFIPPVAGG